MRSRDAKFCVSTSVFCVSTSVFCVSYIRILRLYIRIAGCAGCIRGAISFVDDNYSMQMVWHYNKYVQNLHVLHALHGEFI